MLALGVIAGCDGRAEPGAQEPAVEAPASSQTSDFTLRIENPATPATTRTPLTLSPQCGTGEPPPRGSLAWEVDSVTCFVPDIAGVLKLPDGDYLLTVRHGPVDALNDVQIRFAAGRLTIR